MNNETTKPKNYNSFGEYCCDRIMFASPPGSGIYDVIPPNAAVRPGLSEFFEKAGYFVYRELVDVHKTPSDDASILMIYFQEGDCGASLLSNIWICMEMMMGQTVDMPLKATFEQLLELLPVGGSQLKNMLVRTANRINRIYLKDKAGSLNMCRRILQDENIGHIPVPQPDDRSQSAKQVNAGRITRLGLKYGNEKKYIDAVSCFREAAAQGDAEAYYHLGTCYVDGLGVSRDNKEALRLLIRAAELGYVDAQVDLANAYKNGCGVPKNLYEALKWFQKAAALGDAEAQNELSKYGTTTVGREAPPLDTQSDKKPASNSGCLSVFLFMIAVPITILCLF